MKLHNHISSNILANTLVVALLLLVPNFAEADPEPTAHRTAMCGDCHSSGLASVSNTDVVSRQCSNCHTLKSLAASSVSKNFTHSTQSGQCLACHTFHDPSQLTTANNPDFQVPRAALNLAQCQGCHNPQGDLAQISDAHQKAAELYHAQAQKLSPSSPSQTCLNCHSNLSASNWQSKTVGAVVAFIEHASHPYGIKVVPGAGNSSNGIAWEIDKRLPLFDGRMECQTCHLLTAGTDDLLIAFEAKYDLCKGCHRQYGDKEAGPLVADLSR
jgi:hypothetical protein